MQQQIMLQSTVTHINDDYNAILINIIGSLGIILLLIFLLFKLAKHLGYFVPRHSNYPLIKIRTGCSLGHRERIVVVEAGEHWLVLGVTPGKITHLHTILISDKKPPNKSTLTSRLPTCTCESQNKL